MINDVRFLCYAVTGRGDDAEVLCFDSVGGTTPRLVVLTSEQNPQAVDFSERNNSGIELLTNTIAVRHTGFLIGLLKALWSPVAASFLSFSRAIAENGNPIRVRRAVVDRVARVDAGGHRRGGAIGQESQRQKRRTHNANNTSF
ncbi:preprotein translocase subunit SecA [Leifsonia xyli subsp. cynodontis DSM 46306]|uniref:Uncharacterized protein n=1 Tax=Leifsonia xyli subsp. cynodontis DSM 46306 TaxID=1389489 RepID=U3P7C1_LEIXC|nr:preprotein translocase subunit SecA [Leifsonia xyli subsp. cynodontis DSM 46306]